MSTSFSDEVYMRGDEITETAFSNYWLISRLIFSINMLILYSQRRMVSTFLAFVADSYIYDVKYGHIVLFKKRTNKTQGHEGVYSQESERSAKIELAPAPPNIIDEVR